MKDATCWLVPVGTVVAYTGREPPEGWLVCNGQDITDATYAELRVVLGSDNVPDLRGTFVVGSNPDDAEYELLKSGGQASVTLSEPEMPVPCMATTITGISTTWFTRRWRLSTSRWARRSVPSGCWRLSLQIPSPASTGIQITETGESTPHENRPPFVALNYIIKY